MSDDKKIIFSMDKVSKTYQSTGKQVLKDIYLSFFYGAKIGVRFKWFRKINAA
jgi:tetrahydromethanopterin S-methyltransferase subunit G